MKQDPNSTRTDTPFRRVAAGDRPVLKLRKSTAVPGSRHKTSTGIPQRVLCVLRASTLKRKILRTRKTAPNGTVSG